MKEIKKEQVQNAIENYYMLKVLPHIYYSDYIEEFKNEMLDMNELGLIHFHDANVDIVDDRYLAFWESEL